MRCYVLRSLMIFFFVTSVCILSGCSKRENITNVDQLDGREFAVLAGSVCDKLALQKFPHARFQYFNTVADEVLALQSGKVDAISLDEPILRVIAARTPELKLLPELISSDRYGYAVSLANQELKKEIDLTVKELKANGAYNEMLHRWFSQSGRQSVMPDIQSDGKNGVLRLGTAPVTEPFSYVDGSGNIVGFDIEMAKHVAQRLHRKLEVVNMDFGALIPSLAAGKVDMIGACIIITDERAKKVLFSEPYYTGGIGVMVRDQKTVQ
jgi:polar amino acid transport system substrate-binding protein